MSKTIKESPEEQGVITDEARFNHADSEITGLARNFGIGNIRNVIIATAWADGEVGGSYHIEAGDAAKRATP